MLLSYVLRGEDVDIDVTSKVEPYEWTIYGKTAAEIDAIGITADEEEAIAARIDEVLYDRAMSWSPEDDY